MEDHNWSPQISNRDITPETNDSWHVPVVFVGLSWMRTGPCLGWHDFKKTHPKTSQCLTMFEHLWPKCSEVASDTCTEVFHGPDVLACLSMRTLSCNESTNIKDSSTCTSNKNLSKRPIGILRTASSCMAYCVSSGFSGLLHVDATCKKVCGDQNAWRARAELSHHKIALLQKLTVIPIKSRGSTQTPWSMNHEILVASWKDPYFMSWITIIPEINCGSISSPIRTKILGFKPTAPGGQPQVLLV